MTDAVLRAADVHKAYDGLAVLQGVSIEGFNPGDARVRFDADRARVKAERLEVPIAPGVVTGTAELRIDDASLPLSADLNLRDVELAEVLRKLGAPHSPVVLKASGRAQVKGPLSPLALSAETVLEVADFAVLDRAYEKRASAKRMFEFARGKVTSALSIDGDKVVFRGSSVEVGASHVDVAEATFFADQRTFQRTVYRPGDVAQFDLWQPRREIPVGYSQTRKGYVVVAAMGYSRFGAGALVFSKEAPDVLWGMRRCVWRVGVLPERLVVDREGCLHAGGGRPTEAYAAFCGQLPVDWLFCEPADPQAKGCVERLQGYLETNFEPGRRFANHLDFQLQLDAWFEKANARSHKTLRERPIDRLREERDVMRPLPFLPRQVNRFFMWVARHSYGRKVARKVEEFAAGQPERKAA